jgi:hypothetical protein
VDTAEPFSTGQVTVNATPDQVYELVSDPTVMAGFADEFYRARWLGGARKAAVGEQFRGHNRWGKRRWYTICRITDADPGRRFAYEVRTPFQVPISRWQYDLSPAGDGCVVLQRSWFRVPRWFVPMAIMITGRPDRRGVNNANIATTLANLKAHFESV